jgi:tetratricopeptide (TPR) repeat protein
VSGGRFSSLEFDEGGGDRPRASGPGALPRDGGVARKPFGTEVRDARFYLKKAEEEELTGEHDKALRSYSAALGENPLLLEAWVGQLLMLLEMEEYPEAGLWADKALEKFPDNAQLLAAKSVALFRMGHRKEGRDLSDAALAGKGESEVVWLCRGELMIAEGRSACEECFRRAVSLSERKGLTRLRVGSICYRYGRYSPALSELQEAVRALPKSPKLWYLMGRTQEALGLATQARTSYRQAAGLSPGNAVYRDAAAGSRQTLGTSIASMFRRLLGR